MAKPRFYWGSTHDVIAIVSDYSHEVVLNLLHYYIHFQTTALGKGMDPLFPQLGGGGVNSITAALLQR